MVVVRTFVGGIVGLLLTVAPAAAQPVSLEPAIDAYLAPLLSTNNFAGVVLIAKGDTIIFEKGYGQASLEHKIANRPSTIFQIASVSKPFTAAAVLLLAEQNKLDIKAPLSAVLPGYPNGDRLTIHHLLSHTSGIPNINDFDDYADIQRRPQTTEALVALFKDKPLEFEPGARFSYSNSNYNLLAHITEKVSGEGFGAFLQRSIFDPLGLRNTRHPESAADVTPGIAGGYAPVGSLGLERAAFLDWSVKTGNGSLRSDAAGVMRFMRAVHQGKLLGPQSVAASFTPHTPNVGYGWFVTKTNKRDIHHINGRSPGWAAQADYYVADDVTVVVLSNLYISVTTPIARAVGALYFGEPVTPMPAIRPEPLGARAISAISGSYQFGPDYYVPNAKVRIQARGGQVEAIVDESGPFAFVPIDDTHFLIRAFWVPADFTLGADGRAIEMSIDGFRGLRLH